MNKIRFYENMKKKLYISLKKEVKMEYMLVENCNNKLMQCTRSSNKNHDDRKLHNLQYSNPSQNINIIINLRYKCSGIKDKKL